MGGALPGRRIEGPANLRRAMGGRRLPKSRRAKTIGVNWIVLLKSITGT